MPQPVASGFRKAATALGFHRAYNLPLWFIFGGILFGFSIYRLPYLHFNAMSYIPGDSYWFAQDPYKTALIMHLACVLPAGVLSLFQFVPIIRHKLILVHRIDGYIILILLWLGVGSALVLARRGFGGAPHTEVALIGTSTLTIFASAMAYYNIKRLQIDQHRAWMLRTMVYMSAIITMRILAIPIWHAISHVGSYNIVYICVELVGMMDPSRFAQMYPACLSNHGRATDLHTISVAVRADIYSTYPEEIGAAIRLALGASAWLSLLLHVFLVEIYLMLTGAEAQRLRIVSYRRQLEAGYRCPGSAGLTADRWGDNSPWTPDREELLEPASEKVRVCEEGTSLQS